jgi:hypothetical protein
MRKWTLLSAGALALGVVALSGQVLVSQTNPPTGPKGEKIPGPDGPPAVAVKTRIASTTDVRPAAAKSRIVKVTVYPSNALVTREVEVPAGQGLAELVVPDLPVRTVDTSLYSEGSDGVRVLSTRFRMRPVLEDTREDVRKLEDQKKKLQITAEKIVSEMNSIKQNMQMLAKLERFTESTVAHAADKGGVNGDAAITMAKYIMEQRADKAKEELALKQQLDTIQENMAFVQRKLADLTAGSTRVERDAVIIVDRANGGGALRLNYLVDQASWAPQYKLRAGATGKDAVEVDYLAGVRQQSGEDWAGVDVTLSTAQPMLNAAPPELTKLEVTVVARATLPGGGMPPGRSGAGGGLGIPRPEPFAPQAPRELADKANTLRLQALQNYGAANPKLAEQQLNSAAAFEQNRELMKSREELIAENTRLPGRGPGAAEGPSVTYHLKARLTIPSRKDEQVIEVAKLKLQPRYYYKAVPVLARHVYRLADLANDSSYVLLPGEATMYQGADFVGRMAMPLVAIGEEFTAGFGIDPQLQIQRQLMDKSKAMQGGNQVLKYEYRILVSSYKKEPVRLQVWDRLPHAEVEAAGITLVKSSPEVSKDALYQRECRPNNLLRWDLDVGPNKTGENALTISYEFQLALDRNMIISSLLPGEQTFLPPAAKKK